VRLDSVEQAGTQQQPNGNVLDQYRDHYSIAAQRFLTIGSKTQGGQNTNAVSGGGTPPGSAAHALAPAVL
jgi:hypothetical protein